MKKIIYITVLLLLVPSVWAEAPPVAPVADQPAAGAADAKKGIWPFTPKPKPADGLDTLATLLAQVQTADAALMTKKATELKAAEALQAATTESKIAQDVSEKAWTAFLEEVARRRPMPPQPPTPPQPPNPPNPPVPVVPTTLRVLVSYNATSSMLEPQWSILTSPSLRTWLESHCPKESGKMKVCDARGVPGCAMQDVVTYSYRFIPSTADPAGDTAVWQKIEADIQKQPQPWIRAWDTKSAMVIDQELPKSVAATLELLKKFGGD